MKPTAREIHAVKFDILVLIVFAIIMTTLAQANKRHKYAACIAPKPASSAHAVIMFVLLTLFSLIGGCVSTTNPLLGWQMEGDSGYVDISGSCQIYIKTIPYGKVVSDDVLLFIDKLPVHKGGFATRSESYWIDNISLFKDGTGQHAVKIHIPLDGTYINYVLIYDQLHVRTKVLKFSSGTYRS